MAYLKRSAWLVLALLLGSCALLTKAPPAAPTGSGPDVWPTASGVAGLGLSGKLVFVGYSSHGDPQLAALDLSTGTVTTLFASPEQGWLTAAAVSPDGKQIALAYAAPVGGKGPTYGYTDLYVMPADQSSPPALLLGRGTVQESFFAPVWSSDSRSIYYGHFLEIGGGNVFTPTYTVERVTLPNGKPQRLVDHALWPSLSRDGKRLSYVTFGDVGGATDLVVADVDAQHPSIAVPASAFPAEDASAFSPDGDTLTFSALPPYGNPALSWLDRLLGVQVASAHSVPSDLWNVPTAGGTPTRLTSVNGTGLYPAYEPGGKRVAFLSGQGIFVIKADGTGLVQLLDVPATGVLSWVSAR